jgi:hypothetical protein
MQVKIGHPGPADFCCNEMAQLVGEEHPLQAKKQPDNHQGHDAAVGIHGWLSESGGRVR